MTDDWKQMLAVLRAPQPDEDLWRSVEAKAANRLNTPAGPQRARIVRRRGLATASVMAVALLAAASFIVVHSFNRSQAHLSALHSQATPPAHARSQSGATPTTGGSALQEEPIQLGVNPFGSNGAVTSLSQLEVTLSYPVVAPQSPLASNASLGTIWFDSQNQQAALYYPTSGVEVFLYPSPNEFDFTGLPVQTVDGVKAAVLEQDTTITPTEPGRVYLVLNGHSVEVDGFRDSTDLVQVANSLAPLS